MYKSCASLATPALCNLRFKPLARWLALALGVSGAADAASLSVTDCSDGIASGTLRNTIAAASSGDTVDIPAALNCSTITLSTGAAIPINVDDLTITGPGADKLTIKGGANSTPSTYNSVFYHNGVGTLTVSDLEIADAKYKGAVAPTGGCIFSKGNVTLRRSIAAGCAVEPASGATATAKGGAIYASGNITLESSTITVSYLKPAPGATSVLEGGAIYASGSVVMTNSTVKYNGAYSASGSAIYGGGIFANKGFTANYSTISNNVAKPIELGIFSRGGGIFVAGGGNVMIAYSAITGNKASVNSGLQVNNSGNASFHVAVINSTISGNYAYLEQTAGTYLSTTISSSTIAFNEVLRASSGAPAGFYSKPSLDMQSSIFANNLAKTSDEYDVESNAGVLSGANNLILATTNTAPTGTLSSCPLLAPLSDNGGQTKTHALLVGSPAIDVGNNSSNLTNDQRGEGFFRVVSTKPDIGAYERQSGIVDDAIFIGEFEGRCE